MKTILGRKIGMTQIFSEDGREIPVTVLEMGPCSVVALLEDNGRRTAQIAFDPITKKDERKVTKPLRGHFAKAGVKPHRHLREVALDAGDADLKNGDSIGVDIFEGVDFVTVSATSKGRGFAGVIKRHGFKGAQTMTHGTHEAFRHGGSIGMCEEPARVLKGTKMPGQYGNKKITTLNLEVVRIFADKNLLLLKGAVPGPNGGVVTVCNAGRKVKTVAKDSSPKFVNPLKAAKRL